MNIYPIRLDMIIITNTPNKNGIRRSNSDYKLKRLSSGIRFDSIRVQFVFLQRKRSPPVRLRYEPKE